MTTTQPTIEILDGPHYVRDDDGERHEYRLRIDYDGRSMETPWRQGLGITDDPDTASVVGSLISDAMTVENSTGFADWAEEIGLNPDSIGDRETYQQVRELTDRLENLLGRRLMVALMDDEDTTYGSAAKFSAAWQRATS